MTPPNGIFAKRLCDLKFKFAALLFETMVSHHQPRAGDRCYGFRENVELYRTYLAYFPVGLRGAEGFDSCQDVLVSLAGCLECGRIFYRKGRKAHRAVASRSICTVRRKQEHYASRLREVEEVNEGHVLSQSKIPPRRDLHRRGGLLRTCTR